MTRFGFGHGSVPTLVRLLFGGLVVCWGLSCESEPLNETANADFTNPDLPGGDLVVAEVAGQPITAGFLAHKIRIQYPDMAQEGPGLATQARETVQRVIHERCLTRLGDERGYNHDENFLRAFHLSRAGILREATVERIVSARARPTEEEIRKLYAERSASYRLEAQVWYHDIVLATEAEAWDVYTRATSGEDFEALAREQSMDNSSAQQGGRMPPMTKTFRAGAMGRLPELGEALFSMKKDEISKPIATEKGWHVARLDARREERQRSLEEVRDRLIAKTGDRRWRVLRQQVLDSLMQASNIEIFEDAFEEFYFLQMTDSLLVLFAERLEDPEAKLKHYKQVVTRFPDSEHAPDALFMVGMINAKELHDVGAAREAFTQFLERYPDHVMVASARFEIGELPETPSAGGKIGGETGKNTD